VLEDDRHRPIVDELDPLARAEASPGDLDAELTAAQKRS
jgi:hypothetical protein